VCVEFFFFIVIEGIYRYIDSVSLFYIPSKISMFFNFIYF
jgi:hypothetical protein